ncbi:MAG: DegT/DnrJ/EryC1/StrS family aminotransferase [Bacteroidia bacterium]|nr:DegT/DnrJ/EryC1/StrS family aminotransferase [Bacteroidia bacterium]
MIDYENLAALNAPFRKELEEAYSRVLQSGWFILGNHVRQFEQEFAGYIQSPHCIGVASGLDAITLALQSFNFSRGTEVIVPSNTYIATILSVLHCGLKPLLAEPYADSCNISVEEIERCLTPNTKAVVVVHLYGKPCRMDKITELCRKHNLKLIEDCAQSHGATFKGQMTGTFGDFGAFSFYPTKNLGALGDAGAVTCKAEEQAAIIRKLRNYGSEKKYYNDLIGVNSRLDEMQAAFLSVKLKMLDQINHHKRKLAAIYQQLLKDDFIKPKQEEDCFDVFHIYQVRHPQRDKLREYLLKNNIKTEVHYPVPPHRQKAMHGVIKGEYPISEEIHKTVLSLPVSFIHTEDDIYRVVEVMNKF